MIRTWSSSEKTFNNSTFANMSEYPSHYDHQDQDPSMDHQEPSMGSHEFPMDQQDYNMDHQDLSMDNLDINGESGHDDQSDPQDYNTLLTKLHKTMQQYEEAYYGEGQ